jgi:hypothetical integral membrane protein (TIGR02206 family)
MNDLTTFTPGSFVHALTLLFCLAISACVFWAGRLNEGHFTPTHRLRVAIVTACVLSWALSSGYLLQPSQFRWDLSLPLHFCNLANLIGAWAAWTRHRDAQAICYYWALGLCSWAFLTPSLEVGPARVWFWFFWFYHLMILVVLVQVLLLDHFRPNWRDFRRALAVSLAYMALLAVIDAISGWNYGFVGRGKPLQVSPIDVFGPYPWRVFVMALIGSGVFAILTLPWVIQWRKLRRPF